MKKSFERVGSLIIILSFLLLFRIIVYADDLGGKCGDDVTWRFDKSTGTFTLSGTGAMYDYDWARRATSEGYVLEEYNVPWFSVINDIQSVKATGSITYIGDCAFSFCENLQSVDFSSFGKPLTIGAFAFFLDDKLTSITLGDNVVKLERCAFESCHNLKTVTVSESMTSIAEYGLGIDLYYEGRNDVLKPNKNINIKCADGSYIYKYALENNLKTTVDESLHHYEKVGVIKTEKKEIYQCSYCKKIKIIDAPSLKEENSIYANDVKITTKKSAQSFFLSVRTSGKADLKYSSNNTSVKVNSSGKVSVKKNYIGKANITITSKENDSFSETKKTITVTVIPQKTNIKNIKPSKSGKVKVSWTTNKKVNGYQLQYSTKKAFSDYKAKLSSSANATITNLKPGKTYFFRLRAYKTFNGDRIYSKWSNVKKYTIPKA